MSAAMDAAIAAASAASPMGGGSVPVVPRRVLLVDGDGLAYYCAGNDDTDAGEARARLTDKVKGAARICSAERVIILLTADGSHKGHRYAIARVKPYQGQRRDSKRPKNWGALREYMLSGSAFPFEVEVSYDAEADDLFGRWAYARPLDVVIYTQDKDMRMLPGTHLNWVSHRMCKVHILTQVYDPSRVENYVFDDKQYGPKWFWLQMLHGDTADNIPGLPKYVSSSGALKAVGEVTASKLLGGMDCCHSAEVAAAYQGYYGERWLVEMLEQACLLWMRRVPSRWADCTFDGGPMACFIGHEQFAGAMAEIEARVQEAEVINGLNNQTQAE